MEVGKDDYKLIIFILKMNLLVLVTIILLIFTPVLVAFENSAHHDHTEENKEINLDL